MAILVGVVAIGGLTSAWGTGKLGVAYYVENANYMEADCGEGYYSADGEYADMVGQYVVKPFETHRCGK